MRRDLERIPKDPETRQTFVLTNKMAGLANEPVTHQGVILAPNEGSSHDFRAVDLCGFHCRRTFIR